jgi:hypothetical protein
LVVRRQSWRAFIVPWFSAHAVMYFQHTDGPQARYTVWENVFVIAAPDAKEAFAKAEVYARRDEGDCSGSLRVNDRPATLIFGGIRKLISVCHERLDDQLGDGDEVTYSEFEVADRDALGRLIRGEDAAVWYAE